MHYHFHGALAGQIKPKPSRSLVYPQIRPQFSGSTLSYERPCYRLNEKILGYAAVLRAPLLLVLSPIYPPPPPAKNMAFLTCSESLPALLCEDMPFPGGPLLMRRLRHTPYTRLTCMECMEGEAECMEGEAECMEGEAECGGRGRVFGG